MSDAATGSAAVGGDVPAASQQVPLAQQLQQQSVALEGEVQLLIPQVKRQWDKPHTSLEGLDGVYLQPPTTNNAAWDAYYAQGEQRYALQYTVSGDHGVKQQGLRILLKRLKLRPEQVKLVFVVPSEPEALYANYRWQPLRGVKGDVLTSRYLKIPQWVMRLPLQNLSGGGTAPSPDTAMQPGVI
jgi:hypothetical protein